VAVRQHFFELDTHGEALMRYLVAVAVLAGIAAVAYAQTGMLIGPIGRFVVEVAPNGGAWRLDTATGALSFCVFTGGSGPTCSAPATAAP
jgi:hypothetical protein